jgi:hypothetical protein
VKPPRRSHEPSAQPTCSEERGSSALFNALIDITPKTRVSLNKLHAVLVLVDNHVGGFRVM